MTEEQRRARLVQLVRANPRLLQVLSLAKALALRDWMLVSGAVYQTVWNHLTGRPPEYGVKDYDLAYFDPDTSWSAEDSEIKKMAALATAPLDAMIEVRNQARVHLWFEGRFGEPYRPLVCTAEMLERFICPAFAVGVRFDADDQIEVFAPFGLEDCFTLQLRSNPRRPVSAPAFARAVASCRSRWPEAVVIR